MFKRVHSCSAGRVCCSTGHVCCYVGRLCCLAVLNAGHILRLVCCGKRFMFVIKAYNTYLE